MEEIEVVVGRVGKPHGIRGEVTVDVRTDEPERRYVVGARLRAEPPRGGSAPAYLTVARTRWHQGVLLVAFEEVPDRNAAEMPEDPEEFYDHQLVGLAVHDLDGVVIGEVSGLVHGAQDLLVVRTPDRRDALVPFVSALVPEVDLEAGHVVVADRPGLVTPLPED